jgi:hypothetical protein
MNARKKKVLTVLCAGSVFLTWRGYVLVTERLIPAMSHAAAPGAPVEQPPQPANASASAAGTAAELSGLLSRQATVADQPWGRDPFAAVPGAEHEAGQPVVADSSRDRPPPPPKMRLTGVSRSDGHWLAVMRDKIVRVGDVIDGQFTVTEITKQSITITSGRWAYRYGMGTEQPEVRPFAEHK